MITVFSNPSCAPCRTLKAYLSAKNLDYKEVDVLENPSAHQEIYKLSGQSSVPVTLIETGNQKQVVVGLNISSLASILR